MTAKIDLLKALIEDWKAGDIDAVLARMTDDIEWHYAAAVAPPLRGKIKARKFLEKFKSELREVRWRIFDHAETGDRLFVEGVDEYVAKDGAVVAAAYAGVMEFDGDLVRAWRDYIDVGVIEAQKAGGLTHPWIATLIDRPAI
ncbi:MAG TPA: nuclear transport factor 2 family protein [Caulobacteraceae bacterium]|jgi:limonene-1,2-epoxide hydrolase